MGWNLTRRQAQYLRKIEQLIEEYDHSPTYQDIGDAMGTTRAISRTFLESISTTQSWTPISFCVVVNDRETQVSRLARERRRILISSSSISNGLTRNAIKSTGPLPPKVLNT